MQRVFRVKDRTIGPGQPTYVLAEIACAHEGDPELLKHQIDAAADAGADGIQFQLFAANRLVSPFHPNYEVFQKLQIDYGTWSEILGYARQKGLDIWANVFDVEGVILACEAGADVLKLHSTDVSNPLMLKAVAKAGRPLSLAVGGTLVEEINRALATLDALGLDNILLMHGFQAFPTRIEDARLGYMATLQQLFGRPVGYMDHTDGGLDLAITLPAVAIAAGACLLEKHITDDRSRQGTDYHASLDPDRFRDFVGQVRAVDQAMSDGQLRPMGEAEQNYRTAMKKTIVAARALKPGDVLREDAVLFMRSSPLGYTPADVEQLLGQRVQASVDAYQTILPSHVASTENIPTT